MGNQGKRLLSFLLFLSAASLSSRAQPPSLLKDINRNGWGRAYMSSTPQAFSSAQPHYKKYAMPEIAGWYYFSAVSFGKGRELFRTSLLPGTYVLVKDIRPGPETPTIARIYPLGSGRMVFSADDGIHGHEPWITDGTPSGTRMIADLNPDPGSSFPVHFQLLGGRLLFWADDGLRGKEPWTWFPGATAQPIGRGFSSLFPPPSLTAADPVLGRAMEISLLPAGNRTTPGRPRSSS